MNISIKELENDFNQIDEVQKFLFSQIKREFGYGYIPEYHEDIKNLREYYIYPQRNSFFVACDESNNIIATIGIRAYDNSNAGIAIACHIRQVPLVAIRAVAYEIGNPEQKLNWIRKGLECSPTIGKIITRVLIDSI